MAIHINGGDPESQTTLLIRRAFLLVVGTMSYNLLEAAVGFWAGTRAGSVALMGFSLDSIIEISAGGIMAHRLYFQLCDGKSSRSDNAERRARRFIAFTFFALGVYVLWESVSGLISGIGPEKSTVGIVLAMASVIVMPIIAAAKLRVARKLESRALKAEAKETLACAYLSLTLLLGLVCTALFNWWWADAVAALTMVPWLVREGMEGFEMEEPPTSSEMGEREDRENQTM